MKKDTDSLSATGKSPPSPKTGDVLQDSGTHPPQPEDTGLSDNEQSAFRKMMGDVQNQRQDTAGVPSSSAADGPDADPGYDIETILSQMEEDTTDEIEQPSPPGAVKNTDADSDLSSPVDETGIPDEDNPSGPRTLGQDPPDAAPDTGAPAASRKTNKILVISLVAAILAGILFVGYGLWTRKPPAAPIAADQPDAAGEAVSSQGAKKIPIQAQQAPSSPSAMTDATARLAAVSAELDQLRGEMTAKQQEIEDLRKYYQAGIDTEIKGILGIIRASGKKTISLQEALNNVHIRLGLSAIQRRDTYIRQLDVPAKSLARDTEELLYLRRKAAALTPMAEKTKDMNIYPFVQAVEEVIRIRRLRMGAITMDAAEVSPRPADALWPLVARWLPLTAPPPVTENQQARTENKNEPIWKAICAGDFSKRDQLTELTPEAAHCLSRWEGKDLFLNNLGTLSPAAARELVKWQGHWLGLNGLKELSPETAGHLAQWNGKILSLNRLSRISPQVVAALSEWQGEEIELVGITHMPNWPHTRIRIFFPEARKPQPRLPVSRK